ncbi:MAG TPA: hypothetical protein VF160_04160 [Candidatus Dormibacteraeota bacterium]
MHRVRRFIAPLIVVGALGGSLVATNVSAALLSGEEHGDAVASAARTCPHSTASDADIHGDCVASVARQNHGHAGDNHGQSGDNHGSDVSQVAQNGPTGTSSDPDAHGDAVSAAAKKHSHH